jgi:rhombotail lipoprotein
MCRISWVFTSCFFIFLSGCAGNSYYDEASIHRLEFGDARTVRDVMSLKPQAEYPLKIAILPPSRGWRQDIFSFEEEQAVLHWADDLKEEGIIESVEFIPQFLLPKCKSGDQNCYLEQARVSAARLHANTVLFLQDKSHISESGNLLSVFDLTLVGLYIIPGHEMLVSTRFEAALFDVANGYLYAYAASRGSAQKTAPLALLEENEIKNAARIDALSKLGKILVGKLQADLNE